MSVDVTKVKRGYTKPQYRRDLCRESLIQLLTLDDYYYFDNLFYNPEDKEIYTFSAKYGYCKRNPQVTEKNSFRHFLDLFDREGVRVNVRIHRILRKYGITEYAHAKDLKDY